jgi:SH3-like domain-containing protein
VTLFAGETKKLQAQYKVTDSLGLPPFVRLQGHNVAVRVMPSTQNKAFRSGT